MQSKGSGLFLGVKLVNIAGGVAGAIRDEMAGYTPPTMRTLVLPLHLHLTPYMLDEA